MSGSAITYEKIITGSITSDGILKGSMSIPYAVQSEAGAFVITITGDTTAPLSDRTYTEVKYAVTKNLFIIVNIFGVPYSVSGREVFDDTVKLEILSGNIGDELIMDCYNLLYSKSGTVTLKANTYDFNKITSGIVAGDVDDEGNVVIMLNDQLFSVE